MVNQKAPSLLGAFLLFLDMNYIFGLLFFLHCFCLFAQNTFPYERFSNWQNAGLQTAFDSTFQLIQIADYGVDASGQADCSIILQALLDQNSQIRIHFPAGTFKFEQPINLHSDQIIEGEGPDLTHFIFDLNGSNDAFEVNGALDQSTFNLVTPLVKKQNFVICIGHTFSDNDWLYIQTDDVNLVSSSWAIGTTGQLVQIANVSGDTLWLHSALRRNFTGVVWVRQAHPLEHVGFRCFSVERLDDTAPNQTSTFHLFGVVNAFIESIYSRNCTFAHTDVSCASKISIRKNYFTEGFSYGGGGRAYGVVLQQTTGECLVEDNIFKRLRHSILLQSGANGNVCAFNFSTDPYWEENLLTSNSAGELVLHGNYPYANLFEQNSIGNIVIDNSHGANGPDNLFYRNRANMFGIFFSDQTSPDQLFIGNHVTNTAFPYSLVNWNIQGSGHYLFANNNKGNIVPAGSFFTVDTSFAYTNKPDFVNQAVWLHIGAQPVLTYPIPAAQRYTNQAYFATSCGQTDVALNEWSVSTFLYPNPVQNELYLRTAKPYFGSVKVLDLRGNTILSTHMVGTELFVDLTQIKTGSYLLNLTEIGKNVKFVKIDQ